MRLSIRNQILIPLIAVQGLAVCAITVAAATLAARRGEHLLVDRLNGVVDTLGHANFPYTSGVLAKMRGLSGAEFVLYGQDGTVVETTIPGLTNQAPPIDSIAPTARFDSLGNSPLLVVQGIRYFAARLPAAGPPRASSLLILYPETSWRQARREAITPPLIFGGCSLLLMAAIASWIAHRISGRIQAVNVQVARIAQGDFGGLAPDQGEDEIADLVRSINAMCVRLREMSRTIQQSERTRLLAQLAAGLAHQMRNSLTGARMSVQLHARRFPDSAADQSLAVALRQLAMTEAQVKGLLSLGRGESRPATRCDVRQLLGEIALLVGPACEHAKVSLDVDCKDARLELLADESGLRAAVLNLVLNAIDAAGPGGSVRLEADCEDDRMTITVGDTGPGPSPALSETLFDPFTTSKPEGVGLGLALAQQVATQHQGTLTWVRAGGETQFRLALPMALETTREAG